MTIKNISTLFIFISLVSCSNNSDNRTHIPRYGSLGTNSKQFGLNIKNGQRQGSQYIDSTKTLYFYTYTTMEITNDSVKPIKLNIGFSQVSITWRDTLKTKIFLLPQRLTPKMQQYNADMSDELIRFLDKDIDKPVNLDKTLNPTEKCVVTFGVLTDNKYPDPTTPFGSRLLLSKGSESTISCSLEINETLIIPCGQISYIEK
jgi:nitrate/nitrite-specific signal transduction histidine kinase